MKHYGKSTKQSSSPSFCIYASPAWWGRPQRWQQTNSALRHLFDEECDSYCTGLMTQRQLNLITDKNDDNLFSSLYLPTDTTYTQTQGRFQEFAKGMGAVPPVPFPSPFPISPLLSLSLLSPFPSYSSSLQDNSPTNQLAVSQVADWITRGLVNSPTTN